MPENKTPTAMIVLSLVSMLITVPLGIYLYAITLPVSFIARFWQALYIGYGLYQFWRPHQEDATTIRDGIFYLVLALVIGSISLMPSIISGGAMALGFSIMGYLLFDAFCPEQGDRSMTMMQYVHLFVFSFAMMLYPTSLRFIFGLASTWCWPEWWFLSAVATVAIPFVSSFLGGQRQISYRATFFQFFTQALFTLLVPVWWGRALMFLGVSASSYAINCPQSNAVLSEYLQLGVGAVSEGFSWVKGRFSNASSDDNNTQAADLPRFES